LVRSSARRFPKDEAFAKIKHQQTPSRWPASRRAVQRDNDESRCEDNPPMLNG
jgi:hypothetical protein